MVLDGCKAKAPWRTGMFVRGAGFADGGEGAGWGDCLGRMLAEKEKRGMVDTNDNNDNNDTNGINPPYGEW